MDRVDRYLASLTDEGRYRLLIEAVTDYAIYLLDPSGIVTTWNPGAQRFKGYAAAEIIGQHFSRFYTEEDQKAGVPTRALETARREGKFEAEGWRVRKDGSKFWAFVVIDPIRRRSGEIVGFAKITRDLTERKEAAEKPRFASVLRSILRAPSGPPLARRGTATRICGTVHCRSFLFCRAHKSCRISGHLAN